MKKNRKKRLPKYWLGTRMPASLGYQPNQGAGNVSYSTTKGEDFTAEADASRKKILPDAFNRLQQSTTPLLNMFQNTTKVGTSGATAATSAALQSMTSGATTAATNSLIQSGAILSPELYSVYGDFMTPGMSVGTENALTPIGTNAGATAGRTALNAAGKALGIVGAAYGAANMAMDFAHNQDHRTAADMWSTVNTNTYTTDKGNTDNTYSAPNLQAELDYASSQKTSRNLNNTINAAGTGAAIGSVIAPGIGTLIGGAAGALYGLGSWLFGFGDTYEDVVNEYKKTQDVAALKSLQSEASAKNKDVRQGFYERSNPDGRVGAADGKKPVYTPMGPSNKKATAKVSSGEIMGNFEDGYVSRVPGEKNNKDTKYANLKNSDFVISNKFGLSDYAAATGDYVGALKMQDILMKQYRNKAKNGKLPKYNLGTSLMTAAPNIAQSLAAWMQYNNDRKSTPYARTITADYSPAINQGYAMLANKIDKTPYMRTIDNDILKHLWNVRRMPGLGLGGRASLMDSAIVQGAHVKANKALEIDDRNIALDNAARTYIGNMSAHATDVNNQNEHDRERRYANAVGRYHDNLAQGLKNMVMPFGQMMKDLISNYRFDESQKLKNRMIGIYEKGASSKDSAVISDLLRQYSAYGSPWMATGSYIDNLSAAQKQALYEQLAKEYNASK